MKINILFIVTSIFTTFSYGQEIIVRSLFEEIQYVESVDWYNNDIYCAGYTFKTKINDGNSTDAYLINYDETLKPKWKLKISDEHSNIIYSIKRHKDKIYALVTQGNVKPLERDTFISLFIINLEGVILDKISFGRSFNYPSNIEIERGNVVFGHKATEGTSYSSKSKSEIIRYNIKTKNIIRQKNEKQNSLTIPKKIIAKDDTILLFWSYIYRDLPNIMMIDKGEYSDIYLSPNKNEYFIDSYLKDDTLIVISIHPSTYEDKSKYLKIYKVNIDSKLITSKILSYEELGFNAIRFDSFTTNHNMTWVITESNDKKELNYVLIDGKGEKIRTIKYDRKNGNGYKDLFILKNQKLLSTNSSGIYLYEIE
jgi:hypothetical protein